jgi:hypothetical protein
VAGNTEVYHFWIAIPINQKIPRFKVTVDQVTLFMESVNGAKVKENGGHQ